MKKIQDIVDDSIESMVLEPNQNEEKIIDLSGINFELLEKYFAKTKIKCCCSGSERKSGKTIKKNGRA
jgi:type I restriction enzyme R subunit